MKLELGKIESLRLDNGLGIFSSANKTAPTVSVQAWVATGSLHEEKMTGSGISHFLEHMVFQGTKKFSREQIVSSIDSAGGKINAYTSYCSTVFLADASSSFFGPTADIISDLVMNPVFPEAEFKKEKDVISRERAMRSDDPDCVLSEKFMRTMFTVNPLRHPIIGYDNMILAVTREQMLAYHDIRYRPENVFFVVCGDISHTEVFDFFTKKCDRWENKTFYDNPIPKEPPQKCLRESRFTFRDPLARTAVGFHAPNALDSRSTVFDVLGFILGGDSSSRLVRKIQNEKELALNIECGQYVSPWNGAFLVSASSEPGKTEALKTAVFEELRAISKKRPPQKKELDRTIAQLSVNFIRSLRYPDSVSELIGKSVLYYGNPSYALKYIDELKKITPRQIIEISSEFIKTENCSIVELVPEETEKLLLSRSNGTKSKSEKKMSMIKKDKLPREIVYSDGTLPLIDIVFIFQGGTICETKADAGISSLLASCLRTGTKKYSESKLAELMDNNAVSVTISTGYNTVAISAAAHKDKLNRAIEILSQIISAPTFPRPQFSREVQRETNAIQSEKLSPMKAASDAVKTALYGEHPYSLNSEDIINSIPQLSAKNLSDFFSLKCLSPAKTVAGIVGDIDRKKAEKKLTALLETVDWKAKTAELPPVPIFPDRKISLSINVPREQSAVTITFPACENNNHDKFALHIAAIAMNGMNSRLFKKIREENGLAYYTGAKLLLGIHPGYITFFAGTNPKHAQKVLELIGNELAKMRLNGALSKDEFESSRSKALHEIAKAELDPREKLFEACLGEFYDMGYDAPAKKVKIYNALTREEVNRTFEKYISSKTEISLIAGPPQP
jgi:zinc protease